MANVYISFLGTNDYLLCHYQHQGNEPCPEPVRFVQEATVAMSCGSWGSEDSIVIFTTEEAEKRNWWDNGHCDRKTNAALCREGLKARLEKMGLKAPVRCVRIPEGHDETQIWAIFEKIFEEMKAGDRIVFDITHAFRSIPLLATVVLHYAKVMRAIQVAGIYYGAFEVLGDYQTVKDMAVEERIAPILDLGALDQLMDWTIATDRFIKTGDPGLVADLAKSQVGPILRESRGRNEAAQAIKKLSDTLKQFHLGLATCRGPELAVGARKVKEQATRCRGLDLHPPFRPLFERIEQRLDAFADDAGMVTSEGDHVAPRRIGVHAEKQIWCRQMEEAQGVGLDDLGEVHHPPEVLCGVRDGHRHDRVAGLGRRQQVADRTDPTDPRHQRRHLGERPTTAEGLEAAQLGDVETSVVDESVLVELDGDLAVTLDPGHGVDDDGLTHGEAPIAGEPKRS